jgi:signal transduction histidine kinase
MTVIAVQAGAARFAAGPNDNGAAEALASIERTSRGALDEMRRLLTVLRDDDAAGDLTPAPRLDGIDDLVAATRQAGVDVEVLRCGSPPALPAGVELCAYRIVQEALTNVCKHAQARHARVQLSYEASVIKVEVDDDGVGVAAPTGKPGHGLVGMRERVGLYGGAFEAGPRPGGGYRVAATFPIGANA